MDESLEEFTARRRKAKKSNEEKKTGLQLMITDYFLQAKPTIKREKNQEDVKNPVTPKDVLQDSRYDFDRSSVPQDDDVLIIDVVPGRDTDGHKAIPFIHVVSSDDDVPMKKEEPDESEDERLVQPKIEAVANNSQAAVIKEEEASESTYQGLGETKSEVGSGDGHGDDGSISLECESAKDDISDVGKKISDRESALLLQVQNLSKGLEDMRSEMRRQRRVATTKSLAMKVHTKAFKPKSWEEAHKIYI